MARNLYSLMLDDRVVREVDLMAHRLGTSRSNLVNTLLAQAVNYVTPEQQMQNVLSAVASLMEATQALIPTFTQGARCINVKSALDYKYRPTVTYEVLLYKDDRPALGELNVLFRTRAPELLAMITRFMQLWTACESAAAAQTTGSQPQYALETGKFTRVLEAPPGDADAQRTAAAIADYIKLFDRCLKAYLAGSLTGRTLSEVLTEYYAADGTV